MKLEKYKALIIFIILLILMLAGVLVWNKIIKVEDKDNHKQEYVDVSDANNVDNIDEQLGTDIRITAGYLLNYTTKKSGTWYMSKAHIISIKNNKDTSTIKLSSDSESSNYITATIDNLSSKIKKGQDVYFVGSIDLSNNHLKLTTISQEPINYKNVTEIDFNKLYENITNLSNTTFTISGYMITDNDEFKLFESKTTYQNNNTSGNYFLINWQDEFNLTGNDNVKLNCSLAGSYKLKNCILITE